MCTEILLHVEILKIKPSSPEHQKPLNICRLATHLRLWKSGGLKDRNLK